MTRKMKFSSVLVLIITSFIMGSVGTGVAEAVNDKVKWKDMIGEVVSFWKVADTGRPNDIVNTNEGQVVIKKLVLPYRENLDGTPKKLADLTCDASNVGELVFMHGWLANPEINPDFPEGRTQPDSVFICAKGINNENDTLKYQWGTLTNWAF